MTGLPERHQIALVGADVQQHMLRIDRLPRADLLGDGNSVNLNALSGDSTCVSSGQQRAEEQPGDCGGLPKENCSSKKSKFEDYMETFCKKVAFEMPVSKATDISGAVSLASQMGASQTENTKYLIFFSDMFEYRDSTIPVTAANLQNFKVLVVCSSEIYSSSSGDSEFCMNTESKWKQEFSKLGAKEVLFVLETGDWHRKLTKGFFKP